MKLIKMISGKHLILFQSKYQWESSPYNNGCSVVTWGHSRTFARVVYSETVMGLLDGNKMEMSLSSHK